MVMLVQNGLSDLLAECQLVLALTGRTTLEAFDTPNREREFSAILDSIRLLPGLIDVLYNVNLAGITELPQVTEKSDETRLLSALVMLREITNSEYDHLSLAEFLESQEIHATKKVGLIFLLREALRKFHTAAEKFGILA